MPATRLSFLITMILLALVPLAGPSFGAEGEEPAPAESPATGGIEGTLVDKTSGKAIVGAAVRLDADGPLQVTDEAGRYRFAEVPPGAHEIRVSDAEYAPFAVTVQVGAGETLKARYALDPLGSTDEQEVVIGAERIPEAVSNTVLKVQEVQKIPGTQGDIGKIVQSLPGVARGMAITGTAGPGVVVRGAAPEDSRVEIDGHGIPLLYHFGGLKSVLNSDMLERIDFMPGGFGVEYGEAIGGIVDVQTKPCNKKQLAGYVEAGLLDAGFFLEAPIGEEVGFIVAARRSTVDLWLPSVIPNEPGFELTVAPVYWDYQAKLDWNPGQAGRFSLLLFGSHDELKFLFDKPASGDPTLRGNFSMVVDFHRLRLGWLYAPQKDWQLRVSLDGGLNRARVEVGAGRFFDVNVPGYTARADLEWQLGERLKLTAGGMTGGAFYTFHQRMPLLPKEGEIPQDFTLLELLEGTEETSAFWGATYLSLGYRPFDPLLINGGVRFEMAGGYMDEVNLQPRFSLKYTLRPGTLFKAGAGLYLQAPQEDELSQVSGNPSLTFKRAWHYTLGLDQELPARMTLEVAWFYKTLDRLVVRGPDGALSNSGIGKITGLEVMLRRNLHQNLFGWLAYTFMQSKRKDAPDEPWRLFSFDQTHILTLVAGYKIPFGQVQPAHGLSDGWEFGLRFQLVSGNPETPIQGGIYDADYDVYLPIPGPTNSERLPLYHRLDLRIDYTWAWLSWALTVFLDVQNVYDHRSIEGVRYNYDYSQRAYFEGLPILPYVGVRGSF